MAKATPVQSLRHPEHSLAGTAALAQGTATRRPSESGLEATSARQRRPGFIARRVLGLLEQIDQGELKLRCPDGSVLHFGLPNVRLGQQELWIRDWDVLRQAGTRGDIGFGEAYMRGDWTTPNLPGLLRLLVSNRRSLQSTIAGNPLLTLLDRIGHLLRANSLRQARKNIEAHYDLGNDFYALWLDPTMTYSSALFDQKGAWGQPVDLEAGQLRKMDRVLAQVGPLAADSKTLEIGCGWGALALRRLQSAPGQHLGITLSEQQRAWALGQLAASGLSDRAEIALTDYRAVEGQFDAIVSVEMIEAVGEDYWPVYFQTLKDRLKPGGKAVIQAIIIDESLFKDYRSGTDFIQKYIFPGGMLLSPLQLKQQAEAKGLQITHQFSFGQDYGRTLREWLVRFDSRHEEIRALGFEERFISMWRFYLAYCEAGFFSADLDVLQVTLEHQAG
jgi:cyclopropane-fatty-acyl-phospholipid synthase